MNIRYLIVIVVVLISFHASGKNYGFWVKNPSNPEQDILLIGSLHYYAFDQLPGDVLEAIKSQDILVTEAPQNISRSDDKIFAVMLHELMEKQFVNFHEMMQPKSAKILIESTATGSPWSELLFDTNICNYTYSDCSSGQALYADQTAIEYNLVKGMVGIDVPEGLPILHKDKKLVSFLERNLTEYIGDSNLANISPAAVLHILTNFYDIKLKRIYVFEQNAARYFKDKSAPRYHLEDVEDMQELSPDEYRKELPELDYDLGLILSLNLLASRIEMIDRMTSKMVHDQYSQDSDEIYYHAYDAEGIDSPLIMEVANTYEPENTIIRNKAWISKLKKLFALHKDQSFVVIVGSAHLVGEQENLVQLLTKEGYEFRIFNEGSFEN